MKGVSMKLIQYSKCSTCKKAVSWLKKNNIEFTTQDIKEQPPTKEELKYYLTLTDKPINNFFNTSGLKYKELNLKNKIDSLTEAEKITFLSNDGMLIKRPLLVSEDFILIGFKEKEYEKYLKKEGL